MFDLSGFIKESKYAGMREDLVQAGGGNSSYKPSATRMYIKASGYQMTEVSEKDGFVIINPKVIRDYFLNVGSSDSVTEEVGKDVLARAVVAGSKPSIETFLHAVSGTYTLHTHPTVVNILTCRKDGMDVLKEMFPQALMIPYAKPGIDLAKAYFKAYRESGRRSDIVFLQNHGLVVSADTAEEVISRTEYVTGAIEELLHMDKTDCHNATDIWRLFPEKVVWLVNDRNVIGTYRNIGNWYASFCPDCVVFLGKKFLDIKEIQAREVENFRRQYGEPSVVTYHGSIYIIADSVKKAREIESVLSFSAQVMAANHGMDCNLLSDEQQNELLNWDAEKYRKNVR